MNCVTFYADLRYTLGWIRLADFIRHCCFEGQLWAKDGFWWFVVAAAAGPDFSGHTLRKHLMLIRDPNEI